MPRNFNVFLTLCIGSFATLPTTAAVSVLSINFFIVYTKEFKSAHVHNNLSNFQKADGVAVMMG